MNKLEEQVKKVIIEHEMLGEGDRVVAALSGGADSVCLLYLLAGLRDSLGIRVRAVHVHHGLRGLEADRDAEFALRLCDTLGIPGHVIKKNVKGYGAREGLSDEEAGRILRYEALEAEAEGWEAEEPDGNRVKIAVAHHRSDQAETIFHHLFRGSGLGGLKGIPYTRGRIVRPLLDTGRDEIRSYLQERGVGWVEDSSNGSLDYTRNKIRNRLLPEIKRELNPQAEESLIRMGRIAGQAEEYLRAQAGLWLEKNARKDGNAGVWILQQLEQEPSVIQSYVIMLALEQAAGSKKDIGLIHSEQVAGLLAGAAGRQVHLPYGLVARKEYDGVRICKRDASAEEFSLPEGIFNRFPMEKGMVFPKNRYTKWFDCAKIKDMPIIRMRRPGDYIILEDGNKKLLRRFLIDEKIPREERDRLALLADGDHIMWIIGKRISSYYKIGPDTKQILEVRLAGVKEEKESRTVGSDGLTFTNKTEEDNGR